MSRPSLRKSTAKYSLAVAASRIAGLGREILVASLYGVSGAMSAFALAAQVPNAIRALVADAAMEGAVIPVVSELLENGRRREAARLLSGLVFVVATSMAVLLAIFTLAAPIVMRWLAPGFADSPTLQDLTVTLAQLMMPTVALLSLGSLATATLYCFDRFTIPSLAPLVWNLATVALLVALTPLFSGSDRIYAYALATLGGTFVQFLFPLPWLRGTPLRLTFANGWRDPLVRRILVLLLPTTVALGVVNFNLLLNSFFATKVSDAAPAAIDRAFRLFLLPQGLFAVAFAATFFPILARASARGSQDEVARITERGIRSLALLLIPSAALLIVLAEPFTRIAFERGEFGPAATDLVAAALVWWAASLPLQGVSMLLGRVFLAIQRPWRLAGLAVANLAVNGVVAAALYDPLGISGILIGTVCGSAVTTLGQLVALRRLVPAIRFGRVARAIALQLGAAIPLAAAAAAVFDLLDEALGRQLLGQIAAGGLATAAGVAIYAMAMSRLGQLSLRP